MSKKEVKKVPFLQKLVVGGIAGIVGTSIVYPLDMVKTRLQRQTTGPMKYKGPWDCFKTIIREEGAGGLYRGILANLIGVTPEKAIKLAVNDFVREATADEDGNVAWYNGILAGASAGFCQCIATNPMEITKIRMQVQATLPKEQRVGLWQGILNDSSVCKDLGIRGMYKGSTITLLRDVPYSMIFFPLNATMCNWFTDENGRLPLWGLLTAGMVAGCFAAGLMTPMDVIKTRVQAEKGTKMEVKFSEMFVKIFKTEGIKGLYKGAVPRMCVQAPLFSIACTAFELQKRYLMYGTFFPKF